MRRNKDLTQIDLSLDSRQVDTVIAALNFYAQSFKGEGPHYTEISELWKDIQNERMIQIIKKN